MLKQEFKKFIRLALIGFAMGTANVIPGVSGGTIAFISGIYEELISAIRSIAKIDTIKKLFRCEFRSLLNDIPLMFFIPLLIGTIFAFASLTKLIVWLLENHESYTLAAFLGMMLASLFLVFKMIKKWNSKCIFAIFAGAAFAFGIVNMIPFETPNIWWVTILSGAVAAIAMILPGISGSFLLLVLGQYKYIWSAVGEISRGKLSLDSILTCLWMAVGAVVGIAAFSHLLNYLFRKFHDTTVSVMIGFMVGSMWRLWPWQITKVYSVKIGTNLYKIQLSSDTAAILSKFRLEGAKISALVRKNVLPEHFDSSFFLVILLIAAGFASVLALELLSEGKKSKE